jgi:glycosyltransferase involved in cell wall biosynthesis
MRVGVDATSWLNRRGYGRFARNVVTRLVELDPETTYVLYIDEQSADTADLPSGAVKRRVDLRRPPAEAASADSSRSLRDLVRMARAVRKDPLDVFVFPSIYTYFPVLQVPTVVGVHDAIAEEFPTLTMPSRHRRLFWELKQWVAVRRASKVFTVSEASRTAVADRLRLQRDDVAVISEAPDPVFYRRSHAEVEGARSKIGLDPEEPFFLYAGGLSPHKNLETLVDAFSLVRASRAGAPRLVLVGELDGGTYVSAAGTLRERIASHGLGNAVVLPGFVSDATLAALYSGALAVALPSLAEGFGLPAVEAAVCGAPVILSDIPAHRETLGGSALFFPARDRNALSRALERALDDRAFREQLGIDVRRAVSTLSWDKAARSLGELIHETGSLAWDGRR